MKIIKKNYKLLIGIIIGSIITGTSVYAATVISSKDISYDNTSSKLSSPNVKDALDELSTKTELKNRDNIVEGYTYNASTCVTGEESTCVKTTCYKSTAANSCKAGDIIKYKVNDTDIITFHVMYDNGTTMTMQSQKNTIYNTMWINVTDYVEANTDATNCSYSTCSDEGPITILYALERTTRSWSNINDQTYTMGTTVFKTNEFTGCTGYDSCSSNTYELNSRTTKARMITIQEAKDLGCAGTHKSCPKWMNNYLQSSINWGGTINDDTIDIATGNKNNGYWTMSAISITSDRVGAITYDGVIFGESAFSTNYGARAVVVISK